MGADLGLIIAVVGTGITFVAAMIALFLWNRSEANSDRREMMGLIKAIQEEVKDFHIRLIEIEKSRK